MAAANAQRALIEEIVKDVSLRSISPDDYERDLVEELGIDSVKMMHVIHHLEDKFQILFSEDDLDVENFLTMSRIEALVREVQAR